MTIDDTIKDEKIQYNINREAAKISALSSDKINKYEYLKREDILPSDQSRIIEQVIFPSWWSIWKANKSDWRSGRKKMRNRSMENN